MPFEFQSFTENSYFFGWIKVSVQIMQERSICEFEYSSVNWLIVTLPSLACRVIIILIHYMNNYLVMPKMYNTVLHHSHHSLGMLYISEISIHQGSTMHIFSSESTFDEKFTYCFLLFIAMIFQCDLEGWREGMYQHSCIICRAFTI